MLEPRFPQVAPTGQRFDSSSALRRCPSEASLRISSALVCHAARHHAGLPMATAISFACCVQRDSVSQLGHVSAREVGRKKGGGDAVELQATLLSEQNKRRPVAWNTSLQRHPGECPIRSCSRVTVANKKSKMPQLLRFLSRPIPHKLERNGWSTKCARATD